MVLEEDGMGKEECWKTSQNPCYNRGNNGEVFEGRECLGLKDSEDDV